MYWDSRASQRLSQDFDQRLVDSEKRYDTRHFHGRSKRPRRSRRLLDSYKPPPGPSQWRAVRTGEQTSPRYNDGASNYSRRQHNFHVEVTSGNSRGTRAGDSGFTTSRIENELLQDLRKAQAECARQNGELEVLRRQNDDLRSKLNQERTEYKELSFNYSTLKDCVAKQGRVHHESLQESESVVQRLTEEVRILSAKLCSLSRDEEEWGRERQGLKDELDASRARTEHLSSAIEKYHRAIAFTHSRNEFHDEKDDGYFQAGFSNLDSSIQNWVFTNFRGVRGFLPVADEHPGSNSRFRLLGHGPLYEPKEVALKLRMSVISIIMDWVFDNSHCGISMDDELSTAFTRILRYLPKSHETTRWKARTVHQFLQNASYQNQMKEGIEDLVVTIDKYLSSLVISSSKPETRTKKLKKIVEQAVEISNESRQLSSSEIDVFWPEINNSTFNQEIMYNPDIAVNDTDGSPGSVGGLVFPCVCRNTIEDDKTVSKSVIRKATVHVRHQTESLADEFFDCATRLSATATPAEGSAFGDRRSSEFADTWHDNATDELDLNSSDIVMLDGPSTPDRIEPKDGRHDVELAENHMKIQLHVDAIHCDPSMEILQPTTQQYMAMDDTHCDRGAESPRMTLDTDNDDGDDGGDGHIGHQRVTSRDIWSLPLSDD